MNLDKVTAEIRPRTAFEALDLGASLLQAWWKPVYLSYGMVVVPVNLLIFLVLFKHPFWAFLMAWWLKPLFARLPLDLFSRALFGENPEARAGLKRFPRSLIGWSFASLILYRLDPARSFSQPVWQLEGLRGTARWRRASVLGRQGYLHAVWLTLLAGLMKMLLVIALLTFIYMMIPESLGIRLDELALQFSEGNASAYTPLLMMSMLISHLIVEPWYIACGFTLYLNRRIHLEGWDIEIVFRRMGQRLREGRSHLAGGKKLQGLAGVLILGFTLLLPLSARTQDSATSAPPPEPEAALEEALAHPDLNHSETFHRWEWAGQEEEKEIEAIDDRALAPLGFLGKGVLLVLLGVGVGVLAWLIFRLVALARRIQGDGGAYPQKAPPEVAFGLDIRPQALPKDIPARALELWRKGDKRQALALLYRGAVAQLVHQEGLPLKSSHTEGDCLRLSLHRLRSERKTYFQDLTLAWQMAAYAHRLPGEEAGVDLCSRFRRYFGVRP